MKLPIVWIILLIIIFSSFAMNAKKEYYGPPQSPTQIIIQQTPQPKKSWAQKQIDDPLRPPQTRINIPTRGPPNSYQQVGFIKLDDNISSLMPLYGRQVYPGSSNWNYYTATSEYHPIKMSVENRSRDCTQQYGCERFYSGDTVGIPALNKYATAEMYNPSALHYI